jgi:hypothetical protein
MGLPTVICDEYRRVRNGRKQEDDGVQERSFKLLISGYIPILLGEVFQSNAIEGIVVTEQKDGNLPKK